MSMSESDKGKLELIEQLMEITSKRTCYSEIRLWMSTKKFEIEHNDTD